MKTIYAVHVHENQWVDLLGPVAAKNEAVTHSGNSYRVVKLLDQSAEDSITPATPVAGSSGCRGGDRENRHGSGFSRRTADAPQAYARE